MRSFPRGRHHLLRLQRRYAEAELAEWARKIEKSGATRVWAYFNNDYHGNAIDNARQLAQMLNGYRFSA
ncbi:MAG: DUF72 domain-containing protein [Asticcacaulis sp.]|nr:DUF72 domain-containing protein [Asticcacaulis sp.]